MEVVAVSTQLAESNERRQHHRLTARQWQVRVRQRAQLVRIETRQRTLLPLPLLLRVCYCDDSTTPDPRKHSPLIAIFLAHRRGGTSRPVCVRLGFRNPDMKRGKKALSFHPTPRGDMHAVDCSKLDLLKVMT